MAESNTGNQAEQRGPFGVFTLLAGIATLLISAYVLSDGASWWAGVDWRWVLAGTAVVVGSGMLVSSLRSGRNR